MGARRAASSRGTRPRLNVTQWRDARLSVSAVANEVDSSRVVAVAPIVHPIPGEMQRACRYVTRHARDTDDAAMLLDMLGLNGRTIRSSRRRH